MSPDAGAGAVEQFETDLLRMPHPVDTICGWQPSRVSRAEGTSQWAHVWEQEFADLEGLTAQYLARPVHWA
nr:Dabb family protein [Rhodococcus erythropolis]